ncbi:hypothetical protein [Burkholderia anthina]|uniref:hypothetical protein n=1 Tax=Burkholderia anthina TaxID=179879 RepID=UPI0037C1960B
MLALASSNDLRTAPLGAAAPAAAPDAHLPGRPEDLPWFNAFAEGFRLWVGDARTPRDPLRAVPLLCDAARLGHAGSTLLLATVFDDLAQSAYALHQGLDARTYARLAIVYRTAAFWSGADDPAVELEHESKADWDAARAAAREPRLWSAIDALSGRAAENVSPDPFAALRGFEALAKDHPVHGAYLASIAAEEAAERTPELSDALDLMECARKHLVRSAAAGNRSAQKRLFVHRAGEPRA